MHVGGFKDGNSGLFGIPAHYLLKSEHIATYENSALQKHYEVFDYFQNWFKVNFKSL